MTKYTQDSTPTNPFGVGYFQQGVDTSKKLIAERQARDRDLVAQSNAIDTRTPARELAAARASGDAQAIAAADAKYQAALAEKDAIQKEIEQNTALLASTEEGLRRNETALALAESKAASTPPDTVIVNAGNDPAANSTPPVYTVPTNEITPASSTATPVTTTTTDTTNNQVENNTAAPVNSDDPETAAVLAAQAEANAVVAENNQRIDDQDPFEAARLQREADYNAQAPDEFDPKPVNSNEDTEAARADLVNEIDAAQDANLRELLGIRSVASAESATKARAKEQATLQARFKQPANGDWRVRLSLGPNSDYFYKSASGTGGDQGILAPLAATNGVIFPYTPTVTTAYKANYNVYDHIHSNYRGIFYKNSRVDDLQIKGTFTAQDTNEAKYLLAVIHFFRSVTKMFYGQDPQRGTPPPLVYLNGYGDYQFNNHPCVVSNFSYSLPNDVDYIRTTAINNYGTNLLNRRTPVQSSPGGIAFAGAIRLANALLPKGAQPQAPDPTQVTQNVNNLERATFVPTKMDIDITLIPVQTRAQVSKQFSLRDFASGKLIKGGFW